MDFFALYKEEKQKKMKSERRCLNSIINIRSVEDKEKSQSCECWNERICFSNDTEACSNVRDSYLLDLPIQSIYYVPNWINSQIESGLLSRVYHDCQSCSDWMPLKYRRVKVFGGQVSNANFYPEALPRYLNQLSELLVNVGVFRPDIKPNHVLVNGERYAFYPR